MEVTTLGWGLTLGLIAALLALDLAVGGLRPHAVGFREATVWSVFYIAVAIVFGVVLGQVAGWDYGTQYFAGYIVEKSLSVDNLFVFVIIMATFAVPREHQQKVLTFGILAALVLRAIFIALGAAALSRFDWVFLVFGLVLVATGIKLLRDAISGHDHELDVAELRIVRLARRLMPVTDRYEGTRLTVREAGRRALTPFALVVLAVLATDVVFAVDSVPAVYGITGDPYLVFVTTAFALLGLRALYFVLEGALSALVHLGYGLAAILAFIGAKLVLHWAHLVWPGVPEVPTLASLLVIVGILAVTVTTSLVAGRRDRSRETAGAGVGE